MNAREEKIVAASLQAQHNMEALDHETAGVLMEIYQQTQIDVERMIRNAADQDGQIDATMFYDLQHQIDARLQDLNAKRDAYLIQTLNQAAVMGLDPWKGEVLNDLLIHLADDAVQFVVHFQAADGLQLSDRLWKLNAGAAQAIGDHLRQAIAQGMDISRAVREFLAKGEPIPPELADRLKGLGADAIAKKAGAELLTDSSGAYWKAKRVFRTEMNRAHGEAYKAGARNDSDVIGLRFLLSPNHPRPDICDFYSRANLHGLGSGVFPFDACPWPAHPNTLSFVVAVFRDEVTTADQVPDDPIDWINTQSTEWQDSVLGQKKATMLRAGRLDASQITIPLRGLRDAGLT